MTMRAHTPTTPTCDPATLAQISKRVLWLSTAIVDAANDRPDPAGIKIGGHQASSASMVDIMVSLWFAELTAQDRVSVKPHASPVLHAINYLLGELPGDYLDTLRSRGGLQSYPSRSKDPDPVDFSTGSVGIGATAPIWAAMSHRYISSRFADAPAAGRFISLLGDAELDEGATWEAVVDPAVAGLGELLWIVDVNRQSLDRVVPELQIGRLRGMFESAGWQVITLKWGHRIAEVFGGPGGDALRRRLEEMPNEEYQRILRAATDEVSTRVAGDHPSPELERMLAELPSAVLADLVRDLGGHDHRLLLDTYRQVDDHRPTVVFAYTIKGRGLPTEGHPGNHSALLTDEQMDLLARHCGTDVADPWQRFDPGSEAGRLCVRRRRALAREPVIPGPLTPIPSDLGRRYRRPISTQAVLGRVLVDLTHDAPEIAEQVVTCSPDVASSTNLGGWINKTGVWSIRSRPDWFADDAERLLRWEELRDGQHIELGIAETNLVGLLGELGSTWSRWGRRLIPIATLYDPFVGRALEPWSFGIYAGGQSILIGTPSGTTLAAEGGAHQSIYTPSIGLEQPGCIAWEPAFADDLEWCLLHAMSRVGREGGTSSYFRLSTRPIDPGLARLPTDPGLLERRRRQSVEGGYRICAHPAAEDDVVLVGVGAVMPEVIAAAETLARSGVTAGVVCLTSPDLVFRSLTAAAAGGVAAGGVAERLFPRQAPAPIVGVIDGHPHTLSFLGSIRGDRCALLGVTEFGQSSGLADARTLHGIDEGSIVDSALRLCGL